MPVESRASLAAAVQLAMLVRKLRWLPLTWQARTNLYSKGCLQIPATGNFSMICAHLNCSLRNGHSSFVVRCTARMLSLEVLVEAWTVPAGFPHILICLSQLQVIFTSSCHISVFIFYFYFFWLTLEMDTYPTEEHLTSNIVNTTKTAYVPVSMVCTHLKGSCVFSRLFVKRKIAESVLRVCRIEASPQSWANPFGDDFLGLSIRRAPRFWDFLSEINSGNKTFSGEPLRWTLVTR